jgi:hypothetical protein
MQPVGHAYQRLYKYEIVGAGPSGIGSAEGFWLNHSTGDLEFLGVQVEQFAPHMHVVPADVLDIDDANRTITVPYTRDLILNAPHFGLHDGITPADRERIYAYYGTELPS